MTRSVTTAEPFWQPSEAWIEATNLTAYRRWLAETRGLDLPDYRALHAWSVADLEGFWGSLWDYFRIDASAPYERVLGSRAMPGTVWFPGARLNFAEHVLRNAVPGQPAFLFESETDALRPVLWDDLARQVRTLATRLRLHGLKPGDRVVSYMPVAPETVVAMLAAIAVGAIWSSCSPDFGVKGALDRFRQIRPKYLFAVDGYVYGGKVFDRSAELKEIVRGLDDLALVILVPKLDDDARADLAAPVVRWSAFMAEADDPAGDFRFEQVAFDHPLWILYSSGTTGLPKPIVHGHGGIVLEMLKAVVLQHDIRPGERPFFFTTTGWMMWNFVVGTMLGGACPVLYDGSPSYPSLDRLWRLAAAAGVSFFGTSPTFVDAMARAGIVPGRQFDLTRLRAAMPAGSPVSPECVAWFYENVKSDLWVCPGSGGTDICSGIVGGVATEPVRGAVLQGPALGVAVKSFNEAGEPMVGEVGELVITEPLPSMPLFFWGDEDGARLHDSYFATFPGIWRHGDFLLEDDHGRYLVLGRSDATLNRFGVRIGTAEIYRGLARFAEIENALIVNLDLPGGKFFMPLFVKLAAGHALTPELSQRIGAALREEYTPRHVPDRIYAVPAIPITLTGKKLEVPVRRILAGGDPAKVANVNAMADPSALDWFIDYARTQHDYTLS